MTLQPEEVLAATRAAVVPAARDRAQALAKVLRSLWPDAPLYGCMIHDGRSPQISAIDHQGRARWTDVFAALVSAHGHLQEAVALPATHPELANHHLVLRQIAFEDKEDGVLAIAEPLTAGTDQQLALRMLLALCSLQVAAVMHAEEGEQQVLALRQALMLQEGLADIGELVGPVAHEVNNYLNTILLQLSIVEQEFPDVVSDVSEIRKQGRGMSGLMRQLQQYLHRVPAPPTQAVDLRQIIEDMLAGWAESDRSRIELTFAPDLPPIRGSAADLQRLCRFLLRNLLQATEASILQLRTRADKGRAILEVIAPVVLPDDGAQLFEAQADIEQVNSLELAACKRIVHRLGGSIHAEELRDGGGRVWVEFAPFPPIE